MEELLNEDENLENVRKLPNIINNLFNFNLKFSNRISFKFVHF